MIQSWTITWHFQLISRVPLEDLCPYIPAASLGIPSTLVLVLWPRWRCLPRLNCHSYYRVVDNVREQLQLRYPVRHTNQHRRWKYDWPVSSVKFREACCPAGVGASWKLICVKFNPFGQSVNTGRIAGFNKHDSLYTKLLHHDCGIEGEQLGVYNSLAICIELPAGFHAWLWSPVSE